MREATLAALAIDAILPIPDGDYCFSLPTGFSIQRHGSKTMGMKTTSASPGAPKAKAQSRRSSGTGGSGDMAGAAACPREQMIAEAAYYRAEQRGFSPGNEMADWLQAEADIERAAGSN